MNIYNLRPYLLYKRIIVPPTPPSGKKNICFIFFGENVSFTDVYKRLNIPVSRVRFVYVPLVTKYVPSRLTGPYRRELRRLGLMPLTSSPGKFDVIPQNRHFFLELGSTFEKLYKRYALRNFRTSIAVKRMSIVFNIANSVPSNYEKILLYCVCLDEKLPKSIYDRKFFAVFRMILMWLKNRSFNIAFDKVLLFVYKKDTNFGYYTLLFDKNRKLDVGRIKSVLMKFKFDPETDEEIELDIEDTVDDIVTNTNIISEKDKKDPNFILKITGIIKNYIKLNPAVLKLHKSLITRFNNVLAKKIVTDTLSISKDEESIKKDEILVSKLKQAELDRDKSKETKKTESAEKSKIGIDPITVDEKYPVINKDAEYKKEEQKLNIYRDAVLFSAVLSSVRAKTILPNKSIIKFLSRKENVDLLVSNKVIKKITERVISKPKSKCTSTDPIIKNSKPELITEHVNPGHIIKKRVEDYNNLVNEIERIFSILQYKRYPLKVKDIQVLRRPEDPGEIQKSEVITFRVILEDRKGKEYDVYFDIPYMDKDGFMYLNGNKRVLVYQMVIYPIFFLEPFKGKLTSSYSSITIEYKLFSKGNYFLIYIGGEKMPLILFLPYFFDFYKVLDDYKVKYTITNDKADDTKYSFKLNDGYYLNLYPEDELGKGLIEGFKYITKLNVKLTKDNINDKNTWQDMIAKFVGNRNIIYVLEQVVSNILTPIEINILSTRGYPTDLYSIIKYICEKAMTGYVDHRIDVRKQRVRTVEIIGNLLQKQILSAYNEYESKIDAGDVDAKFYLDEKQIYSSILTSQNIQMAEYINPVEEISMLTRVTPIGIGGLPNYEGMPSKYLDIHESYYGNIDPLETPNSNVIGIQQHLTMGANITNLYGSFLVPKKDKVKTLEILSATPSLIPFVESNEGARVIMACGQMKQAVPLINPEKPAVQTGYESILPNFLSKEFVKKAPASGVVTEIADKYITIKSKSGKKYQIDISETKLYSGQGKHGLSIFRPLVKPGETVKEGQLIAEGSCLRDGVISLGINVLAAYMPWFGYNFEDGMVVSEEIVDKFSSLHIEKEEVIIPPDRDVFYVAEIGTETQTGDILLTYGMSLDDPETYEHVRSPGGIVKEIRVYSNVAESHIPEKLIPYYQKTKEEVIKEKGEYSIRNFKINGLKFKGILVIITVSQVLKLIKGDKLNNRHFNKGVVAIIEKAENMPVTPWGERVQMIYNPLAIVNRMIVGQVLELHAGLISRKLYYLIKDKPRKEFQDYLFNTIKILGNEIYYKNIKDYFTKMSDSEYNEVREKVISDGFFPLIFPPFKSPNRKNFIEAMKYLGLKPRYKLWIPKLNTYSDPVAVGYVYVMKLEHMSEKKLHARSVGKYTPKLVPVRGKRLGGGQRFGEYEVYSLLTWDAYHIIDEMLGPLSSDHVSKNALISEIIKKGSASFKKPVFNPIMEMLYSYLLSVNIVFN